MGLSISPRSASEARIKHKGTNTGAPKAAELSLEAVSLPYIYAGPPFLSAINFATFEVCTTYYSHPSNHPVVHRSLVGVKALEHI